MITNSFDGGTNERFLNLSYEAILAVLQRPSLWVPNTEFIHGMVEQWIKRNPQERKRFERNLYHAVVAFPTRQFWRSEKLQFDVLEGIMAFYHEDLDHIFKWKFTNDDDEHFISVVYCNRVLMGVSFNAVYTLNFQTMKWQRRSPARVHPDVMRITCVGQQVLGAMWNPSRRVGKWQFIDLSPGRIRDDMEPVVENLPLTTTIIHHDGTIFAMLQERGSHDLLVTYSLASGVGKNRQDLKTLQRIDRGLSMINMRGDNFYFAFDYSNDLHVYSMEKGTMETLKLQINMQRQFVFVTENKIVFSSHDEGRKTFTLDGKSWDRTGEPNLQSYIEI